MNGLHTDSGLGDQVSFSNTIIFPYIPGLSKKLQSKIETKHNFLAFIFIFPQSPYKSIHFSYVPTLSKVKIMLVCTC